MSLARPILVAFIAVSTAAMASPEAAPVRPRKQYTIEQFMATTSLGGASFSPDESKILFSSNVTGIFNVYTVSVNGGEPKALTTSTTDTTQAVAFFPADERVLFTRDNGGNELNHLYVRETTGQERDLTPGEKLKAVFQGFNHAGTAFHVLTNERDPKYFDLYRYDAKTYDRTLVYKDEVGYFFGDISEDGQWIAFGKVATTSDSDIYLYDTARKEMKHLTPHQGQVANSVASFDPAGKALYYLTNEGGEFARVKRYVLAGGRHEEVEKADWDIASTTFSHDGRYRVTAINEDGRTLIRLHDQKTGQPVALPKLPAADITSVVVSRSEKRLAFYVNGDRSPGNLYVYTLGEAAPRRLTESLNKDIDAEDLVEAEVVRFKSFDGMAVPNILWKPLQASATSPAPALVWVHGGPGGQTRKGYSALIQYLVNHGYVVLGINNRGSSGYGQTFFTADDQKHGKEPLWDCVEAKKYLSSLPYVDKDRIGIIGGSYGGYMVLAALAFQPDVFGVGIDIFGVSNWLRTLEGIPSWWEAQRVALYKEIGDPVAQKEMLKEISPVFHADKIKKPLLVLQGENDPRVIKAESDDIVASVKKNGVPVEYIVFPDEGHGFTKRANQITGYGAILAFLDKYLKGTGAAKTGASVGSGDSGEALRDAARKGDVAGVKALLDSGVKVEAAARHGQTALYFAADQGHLDVVKLLVERGADVNVRDRFFKGSALGLALGNGHLEVARYLLAHGARDADEALQAAVTRGDVELARLALASGPIEPLDLLAVRRAASAAAAKGEKGASEVEALLASATPTAPQRAPFTAGPERLTAYAGRYRAGAAGEARVEVRGDGLVLFTPEKPEVVLHAVAEDRFLDATGSVGVSFGGRASLVEGMQVNRSGEVSDWSAVTSDPTPLRTASATPAVPASVRVAAKPWPQFRGERASGIGDGQGAPLDWSLTDSRNVRFKTALPGLSNSSPIVWGDRIFVTAAVSGKGDKTFRTGLYGDGTSVDDTSEHSFRLLALDKADGRILWDREVWKGAPTVKRHLKSSLSNATPATDGQRVVVLFGSVGVLAAYDFEGKALWQRDIGVLDCNDPQSGTAEWGHASSPVLYGDLVLVQADRRKDSFLAAYRVADGQEAWRVARDEGSTWATPNLVSAAGGDELVTNGRTIRAYDPKAGKLLWTLGPNSEVVVATPVISDGIVYVTAGYPPVRPVYAVRPGQRGDLTLPDGETKSSGIAWSHSRGGTYIPTPLLYRGYLYTLNNNGILTCYHADSGEQAYQTRLGTGPLSFAASPVAADGRIYFASETGEVYVVKAGPEQELLATNTLDEVIMATPAISDGLMIFRTLGHVVGLGEGQKAAAR